MSVDYLNETAQHLLDAATAALAPGTTGRPAPGHTYLGHGAPTGDYCCDDGELSVWLPLAVPQDLAAGVGSGTARVYPQSVCAVLWDVSYTISLRRCWPTGKDGKPPHHAVVGSAAADLMADLWAILTELADRQRAGTLIGTQACKDVTIEQAEHIEPLGGCAGWDLTLVVRANDRGPTGS